MKILIGYDGSADSVGALRDLGSAGLPAKAEAYILTVTTPWKPLAPAAKFNSLLEREAARIAEESLKTAQDLAEEAAIHLGRIFPGWKIRTDAVIDSPAEGLLRKADSWKPDLIVLGCHGRTALGRLLMGSVSQKVLHHAHADVRISRPRKRAGSKAPKVLVAVDGSAGSDHAVSSAAARKWPKGTRIRVLAALEGDSLTRALDGIADALDSVNGRKAHKKWVERKSESAAARLGSEGVKVETAVSVGDPRIVILREAAEWDADIIIIGSRGLGGIDRFVLGSVSSSVAAHADCTVEIIRKKRPVRRAVMATRMLPAGGKKRAA